jgi:hypothetical protein
MDLAHGVGADSADILRRYRVQALGKSLQAGEGSFSHHWLESLIFGQSLSQTNRLLEAVNDLDMAIFRTNDNEMETV